MQRTAAYLVHLPEVWAGGPALLAAFGMGGTETLGWARLLATRYSHLLCTEAFVMAEIDTGELPPEPHDLSFVDTWTVNMLTEVPERKEPARSEPRPRGKRQRS